MSGNGVLSGRKEGTDVQCCIDQLQAASGTVLSVLALCSMMLCIAFMHDCLALLSCKVPLPAACHPVGHICRDTNLQVVHTSKAFIFLSCFPDTSVPEACLLIEACRAVAADCLHSCSELFVAAGMLHAATCSCPSLPQCLAEQSQVSGADKGSQWICRIWVSSLDMLCAPTTSK